MREDFIHYLWRLARFDLRDLRTTSGQPISIQDFGTHNQNAGPDFSHARLRIDGMQWAGNVEMHVRSAEWYDHGHDSDPAYENVILHVVYEETRPVRRPDGSLIPCLELRGRVPPGVLSTYWRLQHNEYWIPCQNQLFNVSTTHRVIWQERLLAERLTERGQRFSDRVRACSRDWEEAFYQALARAMGGRVNAEAMDMLARSLPLRVLLKHAHSLLQLEALLFGQSGLLPTGPAYAADEYTTLLGREYELLRTKYDLRPIPATAWRYLRLRPNNFPTVRIAQLAALLYRSRGLFGKSLVANGVTELRNMFVVSLSNYWRTHYRFGTEPTVAGERRLGRTTVDAILINTVVPALCSYADLRQDDRYRERAVALLTELPAERNRILDGWRRLGWAARTAAEGQALLQLKSHYCGPVRCTDCAIGCAILKRGGERPGEAPRLSVGEAAQVYGRTIPAKREEVAAIV